MSRQSYSVYDRTFSASAPVQAHRVVGWDGVQASVQGQSVAGVALANALAGEDFAVTMIGTAVIEAGGAIDPGDKLIAGDDGRAIAGELGHVFGYALQGAAAGGFVEAVLLCGRLDDVLADLASVEADKGASLVGVEPITQLAATQVQAALEELASDHEGLVTDLASVEENKGATLLGVYDPDEKFTATDVRGILLELEARIAALELVG